MTRYLTLVLITLAGCTKDGISESQTANPRFNVTKLFEIDGCTVYRFYDYKDVYFTNCNSTMTHESCGRGCTRPVEVKSR